MRLKARRPGFALSVHWSAETRPENVRFGGDPCPRHWHLTWSLQVGRRKWHWDRWLWSVKEKGKVYGQA